LELKQYLKPLLKWWWLIAAATLVAAVSSFLVTRQQPFNYASKATLLVGRSIQSTNPQDYEINASQQLGETYANLATRQPVRSATQAALGLSWLPGYTARMLPNTQLLEIQVVDTDPGRAQAVADEVANQLILQTPSEERDLQQRRDYVNKELQRTEAAMDETKTEIRKLQEQMASMFSARQIADTQNQIAALQQKLNSYQTTYLASLDFVRGGVNTLQVVEPANLPTAPIGPNKGATILLAAVIGFVLAAGAAYLLEYLDDTLKSPDDVKAALKLSTLGTITRIDGEQPETKLIAALQPASPNAEAYRVLRTNLQFSTLDSPLRTLAVTSPQPLEGKSTTLANLAVVLAQQGKRVVVVDTDLRRPTQHRIFGVPNNTGLTTAVLQEPPASDGLLKETVQENLWLLTTGPLPPYPAELLGSRRFAAVVEDLKARADVVLFDTPPVLSVADAAILASQVDGVLLVVDAGVTRRGKAVQAREALDKVGAKVLGVSLNRVSAHQSDYYYYYSYTPHSDNGNTPRKSRRAATAGGSKRAART
jgi:capsular exopolysaccharide synthesis family protein